MQKQIESMMPTPQQIVEHIDKELEEKRKQIVRNITADSITAEQNAILQELKALHLRMEHQTVCNDAGGNRMWSRAWRLVNEAINVIKEDKETFKW